MADRQYAIGPFRFDPRAGELRRDRVATKLTPRAAAVLAALVDRAEQLVSKQELFERVWDGRAVTDDALTSCIQELRHSLGDDARRPHYIETRHRRGYRLIVPATPVADMSGVLAAPPEPSTLVGRTIEMGALVQRFERALSGQRQLVFVSGEPGIGKSALAKEFAARLDRAAMRLAHGQCLDHHGVGEPFLPLIEAMTRLAGAPDGAAVKDVLSTHAPSWLAQMPALWTRAESSTLAARGQATRERMLRELTEAIESLSTQAPLVLVLEDIHWSDASTLDWLAHVARRPEPARLMILAAFRPADAATTLHGITSELALHGHCHEIALRPLDLAAIEAYLAARADPKGRAPSADAARALMERTGGNPLFMVSLVNQPQDAASLGAIPPDVRRFIERQIDALPDPDRDLLSAASAIRREFATAALAAARDAAVDEIETACARLARHGAFIVKSGAALWPDGSPTELYAFRHDLHRELLYERLSATRRATIHARVGRRLESAWATLPDAIAAEIATHFERGNDPARAIPHHQRAAAKALRRSANTEAIGHLQHALDAVGHVADEVERTKVEVALHVAMGAAFMATRGFGASEVHDAYARAEALCDRLGARADMFPALWGQWLFHWGRSEVENAWRLGVRLLTLAEKSGDAGLRLQAHHALWATALGRGALAESRAHAQAGLALYEAKTHQAMASQYGNHDAAACARFFTTLALALEGDAARAHAMMKETLAVARGLDDPFTLALALHFAAAAAQILGDVPTASASAGESLRIATEHALALPKAWSTGVSGWCLAEGGVHERGLAMLDEAIAALRTMQSGHFMPYLLGLLADARHKAGQHVAALAAAEEGIARAESSGECFYAAELHRLRGVLAAQLDPGRREDATASIQKATEIAREQGAGLLEQRARASLQALPQ